MLYLTGPVFRLDRNLAGMTNKRRADETDDGSATLTLTCYLTRRLLVRPLVVTVCLRCVQRVRCI